MILLDNEKEMKNTIADREKTINSLIDQLKQLQSHESILSSDNEKNNNKLSQMKELIKNMDQELKSEKAQRQLISEKYDKDTTALNATICKMNEKLKLVSTIDSHVVDLREQVDKYAKKSEKKDAKILQLNNEVSAYKTT